MVRGPYGPFEQFHWTHRLPIYKLLRPKNVGGGGLRSQWQLAQLKVLYPCQLKNRNPGGHFGATSC